MKKSKSIVIHDFIMENFENGGAFRFDVLSGKTQMRRGCDADGASDRSVIGVGSTNAHWSWANTLHQQADEALPCGGALMVHTNLQKPQGACGLSSQLSGDSLHHEGGEWEVVGATTSQRLIAAELNQQASCAPPLRETSHELSRGLQAAERDEDGGEHRSPRRDTVAWWEDVTDRDLCTIAYRCSEETNMNVSPKDILNVLQSNDVVAAVHPLRDYLERLPQYDPQCGMDFIELMSNHVRVVGNEEAQQMWRRCFRRWFLSMVQSWRKDEVVNHQVLVLIGPQGIYKTTWLEHLLPPELRAYQCKQASTRELSKDDRIRIAENALINLDEIDAMSPRELNVLKSVITAADINERAAYGYTKQRRVRCASFCASGNNKQFLNDDTGNRRWLPFEVESIDSPFDTDMMMPYQMLYAQAVYELEHGAAYYFDRDETDALSQHNETFRMPRNEEDLLPVYFRAATREDAEAKFMTASEIHGRLKVVGNIEKLMPINKFGLLLQKNGFEQTKYRGTRGYVVVENSTPSQNQKDIAQELLSQDVY